MYIDQHVGMIQPLSHYSQRGIYDNKSQSCRDWIARNRSPSTCVTAFLYLLKFGCLFSRPQTLCVLIFSFFRPCDFPSLIQYEEWGTPIILKPNGNNAVGWQCSRITMSKYNLNYNSQTTVWMGWTQWRWSHRLNAHRNWQMQLI